MKWYIEKVDPIEATQWWPGVELEGVRQLEGADIENLAVAHSEVAKIAVYAGDYVLYRNGKPYDVLSARAFNERYQDTSKVLLDAPISKSGLQPAIKQVTG